MYFITYKMTIHLSLHLGWKHRHTEDLHRFDLPDSEIVSKIALSSDIFLFHIRIPPSYLN